MASQGTSANQVGSHALSTAATAVLGRLSVLLLSLLVARTLSPFEVGTLGLAVLIVGLVSMLVSFPEGAAVILRPAEGDAQPALAGALASLAGTITLCGVVHWTLEPLAAALGGDADGAGRIRSLTVLLLWQPVLESLGAYPRILLRRRLDLGRLAGIQLLGALLFAASAAIMLGLGLRQASVVWGQLLGTATTTALLWQRSLSRLWMRPAAWPTFSTWSALSGDSVRLLSGGLGGYLSERLDNILVAGTLGPASAGFYTLAWNLSRIPVNTLSQVVYGVVIPTAAACRRDAARFASVLRDTLRFSILPVSLAGSTLFFFGPLLVEAILGSKWQPSGPALRVMAVAILNTPFHFGAGVLLVVSHRAHVIGLATAAHLTLQVALIPWLASRYGVVGAAYADLAGMTAVTLVLVAGVVLGRGPTGWLSLRALGVPVLAAIASGTCAATVVPGARQSALGAFVGVVVTLLLFPAVMSVLGEREAVSRLASLVRGWMGRLGTARSRPA